MAWAFRFLKHYQKQKKADTKVFTYPWRWIFYMANTKQSTKNVKPSKDKTETRPTRRREKPKAFGRYEQDHPIQLSLFQILEENAAAFDH